MKSVSASLMALAAAAPGGLNGAADRAARADRSVNSGATPADSAFSRMLDRSRDSLAGTAAEQATNRSPEPSEQRYAQRQAEARDRESEAVRGRETGARSPIERALEARQAQRRLDEARARDQQVRERQSINTAAANADATEMASGRAMSNEAAPRAVSAARPATSSDRKAGASSMPAEPSSDTTETVVGEGRPGVAKDIASDHRSRGQDSTSADPSADVPRSTPSAPSGPTGVASLASQAAGEPIASASGTAVDASPAGAFALTDARAAAESPADPGTAPSAAAAGSGSNRPAGPDDLLRSRSSSGANAGLDGASETRGMASVTGAARAEPSEANASPASPSSGERFEQLLTTAQAASSGVGSAASPVSMPVGPSAPAPTTLATDPAQSASASGLHEAVLTDHLDSPGFAPSLAQQVSVLTRDGIERAHIRLNPVEMGPVSVQIQLDGQVARVEFVAEQAPTRSALEASLPQLAAALREAGFTLGGGGVFHQSGGRSGSDSQGRSADRGVARSARNDGSELPPLEGSAGSRRTALGAVDLYA